MGRIKIGIRDLVHKPSDAACLVTTTVVAIPFAVAASPFILMWSLARYGAKCGEWCAEKCAVSPH